MPWHTIGQNIATTQCSPADSPGNLAMGLTLLNSEKATFSGPFQYNSVIREIVKLTLMKLQLTTFRALLMVGLWLTAFVSQANAPKAEIPFEIKNGHMHFNMAVNGNQGLHFIFDTGARMSLLHDESAKKLGVKTSGRQTVQGASGTTTIARAPGQKATVGGIALDRVTFLVMDVGHLQDEDTPLDGVIGADILNLFVVEIDYDDSVIRLYDRKGFDAPAGWYKQNMSLQTYGVPIIAASLNLPNGKSLEGPYLVDTGAAVTLKLNTPFVNKNELIDELGKHYSYTARALSAEATDEVSRLPGYTVFGHEFNDISVRLSQGRGGVSGHANVNGILGLSILKRFNTIYDYYNQVMYVTPSKYYNEAFRFNYSGLKVEKENNVFRVEVVYENSSADAAQLQVGDLITQLDGKAKFTRLEFYDYFQKAGKTVTVSFTRNGKEMTASLTPKSML